MQILKAVFLLLGSAALLAACSGGSSMQTAPVERTGYYEVVDGKSIEEQALEWAYAGHVVEMRKLLEKDDDLINVVVDDVTPLMAAVMNESGDMVNFLLDRGADPNLATGYGTPLSVAYDSEADRRIVNALKKHGAQ